jgi:hypothetical protein
MAPLNKKRYPVSRIPFFGVTPLKLIMIHIKSDVQLSN